ncbi:MAG: dienelactone hydrolase family protein [Burkholderiaceae bacterium]
MGENIEIGAADGHRFKAWRASPQGTPRGLVVIAPEIFGVNDHIRAVADSYAAEGYLTLAPALFDRKQPDYEAGYDETAVAAGIAIISDISFDEALRDIEATINAGKAAGKAAVIGYCWGGTIAWLAAARTVGLACAVAYYGGGIPAHRDEKPACPLMLHFGERDTHPSLADAQAVARETPQAQAYFYAAGHGFNCDHRGSYDVDAATLARQRTLAFLADHLG